MDPLSSLRPASPPTPAPNPISPADLERLNPTHPSTPSLRTSPTPSFDSLLGKLVNDVNHKQLEAGASLNGLMAGHNVPLHQAVIALEEASVSFQLMVEVRNRLLESYQELMRMQV